MNYGLRKLCRIVSLVMMPFQLLLFIPESLSLNDRALSSGVFGLVAGGIVYAISLPPYVAQPPHPEAMN